MVLRPRLGSTAKKLSGISEAGARHQGRLLDRKGADRFCRGLLHNGPPVNVH
jgi:hypothetical protein